MPKMCDTCATDVDINMERPGSVEESDLRNPTYARLTLFTASLSLLTVLAAPWTVATHETGPCSSDGNVALGIITIKVAEGVAVYIDDRNYPLANGLWLYLESNGENWLQRGGVHPVLGDLDAEICNESANPDTILF